MKASRSEAARVAVWADESNLPHARLQGQAPGGRRERPSCGEGDAAGATWWGRQAALPKPTALDAALRARQLIECKYCIPQSSYRYWGPLGNDSLAFWIAQRVQ